MLLSYGRKKALNGQERKVVYGANGPKILQTNRQLVYSPQTSSQYGGGGYPNGLIPRQQYSHNIDASSNGTSQRILGHP